MRSGAPASSRLRVKFCALFHELLRLFFHTAFERFFNGHALFNGVLANVFRDFHGAELRAARAAKVSCFSPVLRKCFFIMELPRYHCGFKVGALPVTDTNARPKV